MTTLNARANQAWRDAAQQKEHDETWFMGEEGAFEEGWETGYKAAAAEAHEMALDLQAARASMEAVALALREEAEDLGDPTMAAWLNKWADRMDGGA